MLLPAVELSKTAENHHLAAKVSLTEATAVMQRGQRAFDRLENRQSLNLNRQSPIVNPAFDNRQIANPQ